MSAPNTKASKLERLLRRQSEMELQQQQFLEDVAAQFDRLYEAMRTIAANSVNQLESAVTMRKMVDHVARLTREKETLVKMLGWQEIQRQLKSANTYMGEPR